MDLHSTLEFIYKCFIAIGLIIPALSLILSGIDIIGLDDVDLNMEGTEGADAFNVSCLMLGMVVTGAFGIWLDDILTTIQALLVSLGIGTIAYDAVKSTTGFDLTRVMEAQTIDAKTERNVHLDGAPLQVKVETESKTDSITKENNPKANKTKQAD